MSNRNSRKSLLSMSSCLVLLISLVFPGNALAGVSLPDVAPQLSAQVQNDTQVALQWSLPVRVNVGGFEVERSLDPLDGFVVIASTSKATMSAIDQNVESGQSYYYRIRAFKRSTYSAYSNTEFADIPVTAPVDAAPPSVILINPADNVVFTSEQTVNLNADAIDDIGVDRVDFFCDDILVGSDALAPYSYGWAISQAHDGQRILKAKAYDKTGKEGVSVAKTVTVDIAPVVLDAPPTIGFSSPANGTVYSSDQTITIVADAQDDNGIAKVEFYNGSTLLKADGTLPFSYNWAVTEANNGSYGITAKAFDSIGQVTTSSALNVVVDIAPVVLDAPPTIGFSSPANGTVYNSDQNITMVADAQDDNGIAKVEFYNGSTLLKADGTLPFSYNWPVTEADNGSYSITAKAFDSIGQVTTSSTLNVVVDINSVPEAPAEYTGAVLESVQVSGSDFVLNWSPPVSAYGAPDGGYDIFVDGVDTNTTNRTTSLTATISGLSAGQHCFQVETRWVSAAVWPISSQVCAVSEDVSTIPPTVPPTEPPAEYTGAVLESVQVDGSDFVLNWTQPVSAYGAPDGGYDIFVDGVDTNTTNRTTSLTATISGLSAGQHCFQVETRWVSAAVWPISSQVCAVSEAVTTIPPTLPPVDNSPLSLRIDLAFNANLLPAEAKIWYDRLWAFIDNPVQLPMYADDIAVSNDTYQYGRAMNTHITSLLQALRVTGDPALLNEVDRLAELMRAELKDWSILTYGGTTYTTDGYLNWIWQYASDPKYVGTDIHEMDDIMSHSLVASMAYAFHVNRDLDSRYAERADFWTDYLKNHFEAKWRARKGLSASQFPFLTKKLSHVYQQWVRYHYYMYKLTGEQAYNTEAIRMAGIMDQHYTEVNTPQGPANNWYHGMPILGENEYGIQRMSYARYTVQAAADLALEGFDIFAAPGFMEKMSNMLGYFVMDSGAPDSFAYLIDGTGTTRETDDRYSYSPYAQLGFWDNTGRVLSVSEQVYNTVETNTSQPKRISIPAGMLFSILR